ncbi:DAK2 domain-containing protein [Salinifilum ghardaiensis]
MLRTLDVSAARRWMARTVGHLTDERAAIDRINVYPVADGDTGTNLLHTARAGWRAMAPVGAADLGAALEAAAKGAVAGARGNSGVLLAQALRGFAAAFGGCATGDGAAFAAALRQADRAAAAAVAEPAQGTFLSVTRAAAEAADRGGELGGGELAEVVRAATVAAVDALAATPGQLSALRESGVVDAGGRGFVVLLDALHETVCDGRRLAAEPPGGPAAAEDATEAGGAAPAGGFEYEVMYLLSGTTPERAEQLRQRLAELGDCISVAGDGAESWAVHVHCDDIGAAIECGIESGRVHRISVTRFADATPAEPPAGVRSAVLAGAPSPSVAELFTAEGVHAVLLDASAGAARLGAAVRETAATHVVLLPNDAEVAAAAEAAARQAEREGQEVVVVPTVSPVQGLAAVAVHDPHRRRSDDHVAMAEAAAATRRGELRVADTEALTWVGRCRPGDVLGLVDGEVVLIAADRLSGARELVDRVLDTGGELLSALVADPELAEELGGHLRRRHPEVEFTAHSAPDLDAVLLLGIE